MIADRMRADAELTGDLCVRKSLRDKAEQFPSSWGQILQLGSRFLRRRLPNDACKLLDDLLAKPGGVAHHGLDGSQKLDFGLLALGNILHDDQNAEFTIDRDGLG